MKEHQFYVKNCIFSVTFVIIVFALQLCIKPLHFHTTAHYSSSHTSCAVRKASILSVFCISPPLSLLHFPLFSFACLLISQFLPHSSLPSSFPFWSSTVTRQAHNAEYLDTYPLLPGCRLIPLGNLCDVAALAASKMYEEMLVLKKEDKERGVVVFPPEPLEVLGVHPVLPPSSYFAISPIFTCPFLLSCKDRAGLHRVIIPLGWCEVRLWDVPGDTNPWPTEDAANTIRWMLPTTSSYFRDMAEPGSEIDIVSLLLLAFCSSSQIPQTSTCWFISTLCCPLPLRDVCAYPFCTTTGAWSQSPVTETKLCRASSSLRWCVGKDVLVVRKLAWHSAAWVHFFSTSKISLITLDKEIQARLIKEPYLFQRPQRDASK